MFVIIININLLNNMECWNPGIFRIIDHVEELIDYLTLNYSKCFLLQKNTLVTSNLVDWGKKENF